MGVSAFSIAMMLALLDLLVDFAAGISMPGLRHRIELTVLNRTVDDEAGSGFTIDEEPSPSLSRQPIESVEPVVRHQEVVTLSAPEPPADSQPAKDWNAIAKAAATATVDDRFEKEELRASMWRQTRSMMFAPSGDFEVREEKPVISDFRFKPEIHVVGLGVTIGSCFIGIPILGVPIEQRTVAINLVVCAQDSG